MAAKAACLLPAVQGVLLHFSVANFSLVACRTVPRLEVGRPTHRNSHFVLQYVFLCIILLRGRDARRRQLRHAAGAVYFGVVVAQDVFRQFARIGLVIDRQRPACPGAGAR